MLILTYILFSYLGWHFAGWPGLLILLICAWFISGMPDRAGKDNHDF